MRIKEESLEFKKKIVDYIVKSGIKQVTISGGEPLCSNNFIEILRYMHDRNLRIILHTNGLGIDEKIAEKISKYVSRVSLALDGSNEEINYNMRGNNALFNQTLFLVDLFYKIGTPMNIKTLVTQINYNDVINIGNLVKDLPIEYWSILEFNPINKGKTNKNRFFVEPEKFDNLINEIRVNFPNIKIKVRRFKSDQLKYCFIAQDGKVYTYNGKK